jgi:hypothetical protein
MELQGMDQILTPVFRAHIQMTRLFFRDFTELNQLIRGEESSDRFIAWATLDFLSDFNGTPHFTNFDLDGLYGRNLQSFAVRGTAISLLQSLMLIYARNHLPFSDGGISVAINDKAPLYQSILALFQSQYEQYKRQVKIAINVEALLDVFPSGVHSDYSVLNGLAYY